MPEFRNIHLAILVPVVIFALAIGLFIIFAYSKSGDFTFEKKHEIVKGQIVSKYITGGGFLSDEKYAIPMRVEGKDILFHTSIATGLKVREGQTILLAKTTYLTRASRDGKVITSRSYYNWYKW